MTKQFPIPSDYFSITNNCSGILLNTFLTQEQIHVEDRKNVDIQLFRNSDLKCNLWHRPHSGIILPVSTLTFEYQELSKNRINDIKSVLGKLSNQHYHTETYDIEISIETDYLFSDEEFQQFPEFFIYERGGDDISKVYYDDTAMVLELTDNRYLRVAIGYNRKAWKYNSSTEKTTCSFILRIEGAFRDLIRTIAFWGIDTIPEKGLFKVNDLLSPQLLRKYFLEKSIIGLKNKVQVKISQTMDAAFKKLLDQMNS